jgi:hypothetical protein
VTYYPGTQNWRIGHFGQAPDGTPGATLPAGRGYYRA